MTACASPASDSIAITNGSIIDGAGSETIPNGVVVITGDRIAAVGPTDAVTIPDGARIVDARGGTVLPGLADMHVHLIGGWDGESSDILGYQRYLNALLYAGVTTVLDVGNVLPFIQQIRSEVNAGRIAGPRIYMVGPLVDGSDPHWPPLSYPAATPEHLRRYVGQLDAAGVDLIKGYSGLSPSMVDSLVRFARDSALRVIVDLGGAGDYPAAVRAGVAAMAHAGFSQWDDAFITEMVSRQAASITTLAVIESFSRQRLHSPEFLDHPLIAATTPPWFLDDLRAEAARPLTARDTATISGATAGLIAGQDNAKRMHDAGILLIAGTDAPYPGVFQGEGIHRELELLVEAGLTPIEAIRTATANAAVFMNAGDEWGTIAPGRVADLIVVHGNPAARIADTRNIRYVIQSGVILDRESLRFDALGDPGFRTVGTVASN